MNNITTYDVLVECCIIFDYTNYPLLCRVNYRDPI